MVINTDQHQPLELYMKCMITAQ